MKIEQRTGAVGALLGWCAILIIYRMVRAADGLAWALLWNLFLAAVPLFWSSAFASACRANRNLAAGLFLVLWLLFLPNAPYILTDLIHLGPRRNVPLWFVLAMLLSCAGTGTLLGYISLFDVQGAIDRKFNKTVGWIVAVVSLMLCGFGIYLGRFLRWNSWDAFTHPLKLSKAIVGQFIDAGPHPHPVAVTLIFGLGLIIGYIALRGVAASMRAT